LYTKSPPALAILAGLGILGLTAIKRETYHSIGTTLGKAAYLFADGVLKPYNENIERFRTMVPVTPSYEELLHTNNRDSILTRAILQTLAKSRNSPMNVRKLAHKLPPLGIGQSVQRIGKMLRKNECFVETHRGHWQVGRAIVRTPS
jgi:hypothetical protein